MTAGLLRQHPFSEGFWPEHVQLLSEMAAETHFASGELIFQEGDRSSLFYLLLEGNVALEVIAPGHPVRVATLVSGEVLGWSSITGDPGKQFQARTGSSARSPLTASAWPTPASAITEVNRNQIQVSSVEGDVWDQT